MWFEPTVMAEDLAASVELLSAAIESIFAIRGGVSLAGSPSGSTISASKISSGSASC
jgi:hypothetical protein